MSDKTVSLVWPHKHTSSENTPRLVLANNEKTIGRPSYVKRIDLSWNLALIAQVAGYRWRLCEVYRATVSVNRVFTTYLRLMY